MANFVQNSSFCLNAFFMGQFIFPPDGPKEPYETIWRNKKILMWLDLEPFQR